MASMGGFNSQSGVAIPLLYSIFHHSCFAPIPSTFLLPLSLILFLALLTHYSIILTPALPFDTFILKMQHGIWRSTLSSFRGLRRSPDAKRLSCAHDRQKYLWNIAIRYRIVNTPFLLIPPFPTSAAFCCSTFPAPFPPLSFPSSNLRFLFLSFHFFLPVHIWMGTKKLIENWLRFPIHHLVSLFYPLVKLVVVQS